MSEKEKYKALLHKRHGWLYAPDGMWFEESDTHKSYWLCTDNPENLSPIYAFPYGTRFNASSVYAVA